MHVRSILKASVFVAQLLRLEAAGVVVHCSDGWDRTSQVCATSQVLLDPFYRTLGTDSEDGVHFLSNF
jgi:hypothetical protein